MHISIRSNVMLSLIFSIGTSILGPGTNATQSSAANIATAESASVTVTDPSKEKGFLELLHSLTDHIKDHRAVQSADYHDSTTYKFLTGSAITSGLVAVIVGIGGFLYWWYHPARHCSRRQITGWRVAIAVCGPISAVIFGYIKYHYAANTFADLVADIRANANFRDISKKWEGVPSVAGAIAKAYLGHEFTKDQRDALVKLCEDYSLGDELKVQVNNCNTSDVWNAVVAVFTALSKKYKGGLGAFIDERGKALMQNVGTEAKEFLKSSDATVKGACEQIEGVLKSGKEWTKEIKTFYDDVKNTVGAENIKRMFDKPEDESAGQSFAQKTEALKELNTSLQGTFDKVKELITEVGKENLIEILRFMNSDRDPEGLEKLNATVNIVKEVERALDNPELVRILSLVEIAGPQRVLAVASLFAPSPSGDTHDQRPSDQGNTRASVSGVLRGAGGAVLRGAGALLRRASTIPAPAADDIQAQQPSGNASSAQVVPATAASAQRPTTGSAELNSTHAPNDTQAQRSPVNTDSSQIAPDARHSSTGSAELNSAHVQDGIQAQQSPVVNTDPAQIDPNTGFLPRVSTGLSGMFLGPQPAQVELNPDLSGIANDMDSQSSASSSDTAPAQIIPGIEPSTQLPPTGSAKDAASSTGAPVFLRRMSDAVIGVLNFVGRSSSSTGPDTAELVPHAAIVYTSAASESALPASDSIPQPETVIGADPVALPETDDADEFDSVQSYRPFDSTATQPNVIQPVPEQPAPASRISRLASGIFDALSSVARPPV